MKFLPGRYSVLAAATLSLMLVGQGEARRSKPKPKPPTYPIAKDSADCPHGAPIYSQSNLGPKEKKERSVDAYKLKGQDAAFYESSLDIDADGSPNAYHPPTKQTPSGHPPGLDALGNAGYGRNCNVIYCTDPKHLPDSYAITTQGDFAGFYVSMTSLKDTRKKPDGKWLVSRGDYHAYVDATSVPYIAVAGRALPIFKLNASGPDHNQPGELAYVIDLRTGNRTAAIYADGGTNKTLGEGSIKLARALGYKEADANPQNSSITAGILTIVFPGSATSTPWPRDLHDIDEQANARFEAWGGLKRVMACYPNANIKFP